MKKLMFFVGLIIIILTLIPFSLFSQQGSKEEGRAVWLSASMFSKQKNEALSQIKETLNNYADIGINTLFCYNCLKSQNHYKWDYLAVLLKEAHKRNIEVHPVFTPGGRVELKGEIKEHPEWLIRGMKGEIYPELNIALPEVRKYFIRQVSEGLKYDIDGIHLDYIRFQVNQGFSYDKITCETFKKEYGYSPLEVSHDCGSMVWCAWIRWNAKQVTDLVKEIRNTIDQSGKNVILGVDVFPDYETAKVLIGQDWKHWAEEGIVDIICPMDYTNDLGLFKQFVQNAVKAANGKCLVYPGIAISSSHNKNTPEGVVQEVMIARKTGADGVAFFSGYSLTGEFITRLNIFFQENKHR